MATKKKAINEDYYNPPETLDDHPFFGIIPDVDQKRLIDAVWKREKKVFLVDSIAGSGKTLIATALGVLMVKYGLYDKIVYVTFPGIYEKTQGFLPGDLLEKSEPYFQPLYDALIELGELPDHVCNTSMKAIENGTAFIECTVSTYMRGINLKKAFVIIDEAENADLQTLTKVLSRINDDCLTMVIGHAGQCDMYDKSKSGFTACIDYQTKNHPETCESFTLLTNHRGKISQWADLMLEEYKEPKYGFIYMTKNNVNGKLYIGQHTRTMNPKDIDDSWYLGSGDALHMAIAKYGEENFTREIIYECESKSELDYMEKIFINYYNAVKNGDFYNIAGGGQGVGAGENHPMYGRHHTFEAKRKISDAMSGENNPMYGKCHTEKTKNKISMSKTGVAIPHTDEWNYKIGISNSKPVAQYNKDGELLAVFRSRTEAEEITGVQHQCIGRCVRGERKTAGGYIWKDVETDELEE